MASDYGRTFFLIHKMAAGVDTSVHIIFQYARMRYTQCIHARTRAKHMFNMLGKMTISGAQAEEQ